MAKTKYSKTSVIIEAIYKQMKNDTIDSGDLKGIAYYKENIYRTMQQDKVIDDVTINIQCIGEQSFVSLPSSRYTVEIFVSIPMKFSKSRETIENISAKIIDILNKKHLELNENVKTKNMRMRHILKMHNIIIDDMRTRIYGRNISFDIICDDEVIEFN